MGFIRGGYIIIRNYPPALKERGFQFSQGMVWHKWYPVLIRSQGGEGRGTYWQTWRRLP
ncbi:MAG: hypothetical protein ACYTFZ_03225 [Planctomycetota bacterium]